MPATVEALRIPDLGTLTKQNDIDEIVPGKSFYTIYLDNHFKLYYRVKGGKSSPLWQGCYIYERNAPPQNSLPRDSHNVQLGGEFNTTPTNWSSFETHNSTYTYYFAGIHHQNRKWDWDYGFHITRDVYTNGYIWTLSYDDNGSNPDYDDFIVEVAVRYL